MGKSSKILSVMVLLAIASSQTVHLNDIFSNQTRATLGPEYQDPNFLRTIDNYFGCKTWKDGNCLECSHGYIFNNNGVCCLIDRNCEIFNIAAGLCERCYTGFHSDANGTCTARAPTDPSLIGCSEWKQNQCVACSALYYFNANGVCTAVSDQCRDWNRTTGACTECYFGYIAQDGTCVVDPSSPRSNDVKANPLCHTWRANGCEACAQRAYFDVNGICQSVDAQCWTWDRANGLCLSCYKGYDLVNGSCLHSSSNTAAVADPGCHIWQEGVCVECSARWVFNEAGICIPVQDICRTFDNLAQCLTCYRGYDLINGSCFYSPSNNAQVTDPGCRIWNATVCIECSKNWVFDSNGICVPVSDACRTHDSNGQCTGCYKGYEVVNGACAHSSSSSLTPPQLGCHIWNWDTLTCDQCSKWWFVNSDGFCQEVSPLCAAYEANGHCNSCFRGYDLSDGVCVVSPASAPADRGCKTWNGATCTECSANWVFNQVGSCVVVSDQCRTFDSSNGDCLSCYSGYSLTNGSCLYNQEPVATGGCNDWNWKDRVCLSCAPRWVLINGNCLPVSDQCRTADSNGWCSSCYRGYDLTDLNNDAGVLIGRNCIYSPTNTAAPSDLGCRIWNWTASTCDECSFNWYLNANGRCAEVNTYCRSHDASNGICLSCYRGYDLVDGTCAYSSANTAAPSDLGCKTWNGSTCIECSQNWAFNSNGVCQQVSDSCKTHSGFECTSCYNGFVLKDGVCDLSPLNTLVPTDAGCKAWDWNQQICKECAPYWVFSNGICVPVNPLCKTYDVTGACTSCFKGYSLTNSQCLISEARTVSDAGCKQWVWDNNTCLECSAFWYFSSGVCSPVSPYCKTYDSTSGACTSCYSGYSLSNGACELSPASLCKTSDATGCLTCYEGFVLYQRNCITLDSIANLALYYAECCPGKLAQLKAEGRIPQ